MTKTIWLVTGLFCATTVSLAATDYRLAHFGNSLMGNIRLDALADLATERGHSLNHRSTGFAGAQIKGVWQDRQPQVQDILNDGNWDAIGLQPFLQPMDSDLLYAGKFIDAAASASPDRQVWIYAQFTNDFGIDYQDLYWQDVSGYIAGEKGDWTSPMRTAMFYEELTTRLRLQHLDVTINMVPAGHTFALFDLKVKAGQVPGVDDLFQLWADGTHVNNFGSYLVGCTYYACLFSENPEGLPVGDYQGSADDSTTWVITPEQAAIAQETAWEVAATHPLSGIGPGPSDHLEIVTPEIPIVIADDTVNRRLQAAFGQAPYIWSISGGNVPSGLSLDPAGLLTGTTSMLGDHAVTIRVIDDHGTTDDRDYTITVVDDLTPTLHTAADLGSFARGESIRLQLDASGGNPPLTFKLLNIASKKERQHNGIRVLGDGTVVGSPGTMGTTTLEVELRDGDQSDPEIIRRDFTLTVGDPAPGVHLARTVPRSLIPDLPDKEPTIRLPWQRFHEPVTTTLEGDTSDDQVAFDLVWNGSNIVAWIRVMDDTIVTDSEDPTQDDCVEVYFDVWNDREVEYNDDDRRFIITADNRVSGILGKFGRQVAEQIPGGYVVWAEIRSSNFIRSFAEDVVIGFDVIVNDDDDGGDRDSRVVWRGDERNAYDPSHFGTVILDSLKGGFLPSCDDDTFGIPAATASTLDPLANDRGVMLSLADVSAAANGSASIIDGKLVYEGDTGFAGTETLSYQVADRFGATETGHIDIMVGGSWRSSLLTDRFGYDLRRWREYDHDGNRPGDEALFWQVDPYDQQLDVALLNQLTALVAEEAADWTDYRVTGRVRSNDDSGAWGVFLHFQDKDHYLLINCNLGGSCQIYQADGIDEDWRWSEPDAVLLDESTAIAVQVDTWYDFEARIEHGELSFQLDDGGGPVLVFDRIPVTLPDSGAPGLLSSRLGEAHFDDVVVEQLPLLDLYLQAQANSHEQISLTWQDTIGETGYRLTRSENSIFGDNDDVIIDLPADTSSYRDEGLSPNQQYHYRLEMTFDP